MNFVKRTLLTIFIAACAAPLAAQPIVTFVNANIGDSAKVVRARALDLFFENAVNGTHCLRYINVRMRDSLAQAHAREHTPFTFKEIAQETGARYGVFFSLNRFGFVVRLGTRVITPEGAPVLDRTDFTLLEARDTLEYKQPFEPALFRLLARSAQALAHAADSACSPPPDSVLPVVMGSVIIQNMRRGFGVFLHDNSISVTNMACARMLDSLRYDKRFLLVDIYSRDQLYARLGEYGIQNNILPSPQEIALMNAAGLPVYLTAEIDSADAYKKLALHVYAFSTVQHRFTPIAQADRIIEPGLEKMYTTLSALAYEVLDKIHPYPPIRRQDTGK